MRIKTREEKKMVAKDRGGVENKLEERMEKCRRIRGGRINEERRNKRRKWNRRVTIMTKQQEASMSKKGRRNGGTRNAKGTIGSALCRGMRNRLRM